MPKQSRELISYPSPLFKISYWACRSASPVQYIYSLEKAVKNVSKVVKRVEDTAVLDYGMLWSHNENNLKKKMIKNSQLRNFHPMHSCRWLFPSSRSTRWQ